MCSRPPGVTREQAARYPSPGLNRYRVQWQDERTLMTTHLSTLTSALAFARTRPGASIFDRETRQSIPFGRNGA